MEQVHASHKRASCASVSAALCCTCIALFTSAPCRASTSTHSKCPLHAAMNVGVAPSCVTHTCTLDWHPALTHAEQTHRSCRVHVCAMQCKRLETLRVTLLSRNEDRCRAILTNSAPRHLYSPIKQHHHITHRHRRVHVRAMPRQQLHARGVPALRRHEHRSRAILQLPSPQTRHTHTHTRSAKACRHNTRYT